ncbi:CHAT domain-containing tetratricopeptide repeat protein [Kamptonema sp. UHCC 0994]|uniref:CHAT domain-containing protein n=1 Tax=Kamptonema sp. UHCC 0994 TaxID=3031329 RepID=UPI0023BA13E1|nr:CHAT domain-containing tetratricopeptide repeat protein [Kamptonema sp. UHCC 0994]MDF0552163.1 CHAT domain-containing protein [Kamptonema sp. UHCC 0994]
MDEQRRETDFNMLRVLLDFSSDTGTELILSADSDLIDYGLVQTLYLAVPSLTQEGLVNAAKFFQNLLAPLEEAMRESIGAASPEQYLTFLGEVLQAVAYNSEPQAVYPLLSANLDKLDQHFAQLLHSWATAILSEAEPAQARRIAAQIGNLSIIIGRFPLGSRANNLEIEIAGYEVVAAVFTREGFPEQWATLQNNLGNAYSDRIKGERALNLERAIACFENALEVRTPEEYPEHWATLQNNLGNVYSDRIKGFAADNLELAVTCYQNALQVRARDTFPKEWATTQNNLGRAYSRRFRGDPTENLELAIACYQSALQVYNRKSFPRRWATTQNNLANAYSERLRGSRADNLERAVDCYQKALQVRTRESLPTQWATTQNNLGRVFSERIKGDRADNLEAAIACYRNALEVHSRRKFPDRWGTIQTYLGKAYNQRLKGDRAQNLEAAIACYQKALQVYSQPKSPDRWAMLQTYLGRALSEHKKGEKARNLKTAIVCYQNACAIYSRLKSPDRWAMLQSYLGRAFCELMLGNRAENLKSAVICYDNALEVYTREAHPHSHAKTLFYQGLAYQAQGELLQAYNTFVSAVETVEFLRGERRGGSDREASILKQKFAQTWTILYKSLVQLCLKLGANESHYYAKALEYTQRYKARSLVELLANGYLYPKAELPQYVQDELVLLREEIATEERRVDGGTKSEVNISRSSGVERPDLNNSSMPLSVDFTRLTQLWHQWDELISREIVSFDPYFSITQKVEAIAFEQIQELLPDRNCAIVEWASLEEMLVCFIILSDMDRPIVWVCPPENADALEDWAEEYLSAYSEQKGRWVNQLAARLSRLAEILQIDRIVECIPEHCDRLIAIGHRFLHLMPIHALPLGSEEEQGEDGGDERDGGDGEDRQQELGAARARSEGEKNLPLPPAPPLKSSPSSPPPKYLIDRFSRGIRYAPNCQMLRLSQIGRRNLRGTSPVRELFAVQNFAKDSIYSNLEMSAIRQHFPSTETLGDRIGVKEALYQLIGVGDRQLIHREQQQQGVGIHFACQGLLNFENPLESALFLGKESLTLEEIFNLDLRQFRLMTLSVCETGAGEVKGITDCVNLAAGLMYAGTPSIVSSLWKVSDVSTLFLIGKFYDNLSHLQRVQVGDIAIALNSAQKWLRDLTSEEFETLLSNFQSQIAQIFAQLPQGQRLIAEASLQQTRNRKPCPFANPYHWAAFTATGI